MRRRALVVLAAALAGTSACGGDDGWSDTDVADVTIACATVTINSNCREVVKLLQDDGCSPAQALTVFALVRADDGSDVVVFVNEECRGEVPPGPPTIVRYSTDDE